FFALFIPVIELLMLGYAIDTNIRDVSTVILDEAKTTESRQLIMRFQNSTSFRVRDLPVYTDRELYGAIVAGKARVRIQIHEDYSRKLARNPPEKVQVLVLIDGSESNIAATAMNVGSALTLSESLQRVLRDGQELPVEMAPQILFNPDTRSLNFFIPGLMVV